MLITLGGQQADRGAFNTSVQWGWSEFHGLSLSLHQISNQISSEQQQKLSEI